MLGPHGWFFFAIETHRITLGNVCRIGSKADIRSVRLYPSFVRLRQSA